MVVLVLWAIKYLGKLVDILFNLLKFLENFIFGQLFGHQVFVCYPTFYNTLHLTQVHSVLPFHLVRKEARGGNIDIHEARIFKHFICREFGFFVLGFYL